MAVGGLKKETAGALSYVLGPVSGLVFLVIEKDPFVRFHAMQSTILFGGLMLLKWVFTMTILLIPVAGVLWIVGAVLWFFLIYKAWQGAEFEVPVVGKLSRNLLKKI